MQQSSQTRIQGVPLLSTLHRVGCTHAANLRRAHAAATWEPTWIMGVIREQVFVSTRHAGPSGRLSMFIHGHRNHQRCARIADKGALHGD